MPTPIRRTIIEERVEHLAKKTGDNTDSAFLKLAYSLVKPAEYEDLELEDIVDGTDDKQIDVISMDERASGLEADIFVLQAKNQASFPTNHLTLMGNGLGWIFEQPKSDYHRLKNPPLVRKIDEVRSLRATLGSIVSYGIFHLARVVARRYTGVEAWNDTTQTNNWITEIQTNPAVLRRHYRPSVTLLRNLIKTRPEWIENVNNVFKAGDIEEAINKAVADL